MACPSCSPTDETCVTVSPVLAPCECPDTPAIREEGPPGAQGAAGAIPVLTVGTVTEGSANVIFTENTPIDYTVDFVLPEPPIDTANNWSAVQTYEATPVFEQGISVTGGVSTFGGTSFHVVPAAAFDDGATIAGALTADSIVAEVDVGIAGNLSVGSGTTLNDLEIDGALSFGAAATIVLSSVSGFVTGRVVLDSCLKPKIVASRGGDLYLKQDATGLLTVLTITTGAICSPIQITVPASGCTPQLLPVVNIMVRIGYSMGAAIPSGNMQANLRQGSISGTILDAYIQGTVAFDNSAGGCIILEGQATLAVGVNYFYVELTNNTDQDFIPNTVTSWITN